MSSGEIIQNTPGAKALQDTIQADLVSRGYASEGDEVMAEFVFVMVCNNKSPAQINAELADLIGPEFDVAFTTWLFNTVAAQYPHSKPALSYGPPPPQPIPTLESEGRTRNAFGQIRGATSGRGGQSGVFGSAIAGVKRPNDGSSGRDSQRQRMDPPAGAPTGPRNPGPTDGDPTGGIPTRKGMHRDGQPLFDRLGPQPYQQMPQQMMGNPGFFPMMMPDMVQMQIDQVTGQRRPSQQQMMPFSPGPGQPPQMAFFPYPGAPPQFMPFPQQNQQQFYNQQSPMSPGGNFQAPQPPQQLPPVPERPSNEALCKHGVECTNAYCRFAHPSPAASKESGLVLSSEPCQEQLACSDADCPKSHISPRAKDPANSVPPAPGSNAGPGPSGGFKHAPPHQGGREKNPTHCKFGAACTRPDCMFTHPWDSKPRHNAHSGSANLTPCRFGAGCTRPDCHFTHPPSRKLNNKSSHRSQTFNTTASTATMSGEDLQAKLKEKEEETARLTERMKRFSGAAAMNGADPAGGSESELVGVQEMKGGEQKEEEMKQVKTEA